MHDMIFPPAGPLDGHGTQMATRTRRLMADFRDGKPALNLSDDFSGRAIPGHFGRLCFPPVHGAIPG